jgi:hypothetical protein
MSRNALVTEAVGVMVAIEALRLKRHQLVSVEGGVEIHQPGKPVLLLTYGAAREFAAQIGSAE